MLLIRFSNMDRKSESIVNPYSQVFLGFSFGEGVDEAIMVSHCVLACMGGSDSNSQNLALLVVEVWLPCCRPLLQCCEVCLELVTVGHSMNRVPDLAIVCKEPGFLFHMVGRAVYEY